MSYQFLEIAIEDHVATVTLARTESMNALSLSFTAEIAQAFRELGANDEVRAIVLASEAKAFCAGLDLKEFAAIGLKGTAKSSLEFPEKLRALFESCDGIEACPKPVIAAVNGMCIGGGLDIVSACDIRLRSTGNTPSRPSSRLARATPCRGDGASPSSTSSSPG